MFCKRNFGRFFPYLRDLFPSSILPPLPLEITVAHWWLASFKLYCKIFGAGFLAPCLCLKRKQQAPLQVWIMTIIISSRHTISSWLAIVWLFSQRNWQPWYFLWAWHRVRMLGSVLDANLSIYSLKQSDFVACENIYLSIKGNTSRINQEILKHSMMQWDMVFLKQ